MVGEDAAGFGASDVGAITVKELRDTSGMAPSRVTTRPTPRAGHIGKRYLSSQVSKSGALRSSVGVENVAASRCVGGRRLWCGGGRERRLSGCVAGNPGLSVVLVSLQVSMVVEGMIVVRGNRGVLPLSTSRRVLFHPPSPQRNLSIGSVIGKARG